MFQCVGFIFMVLTFVVSYCHSIPLIEKLPTGKGGSYGAVKEPVPKNINHNQGNGPLAPLVLQKNPRLVFIGTINDKTYYIERQAVDWDGAVSLCESLVMKIAMFETQEEVNLIYANLPSSDGYVWTGAKVNLREDWPKFYWQDEQSTPVNTPLQWFYSFNAEIVVVFSVDAALYPGMYGISLKSELHYPICYN